MGNILNSYHYRDWYIMKFSFVRLKNNKKNSLFSRQEECMDESKSLS